MRTIKVNPILQDEKKFRNIGKYMGSSSKKSLPSRFYNYAADRGAEFSGFTNVDTGDFIKQLELNE